MGAVHRIRRALRDPARRLLLRALGRDVARLRGSGARLRVDPASSFGEELLAHGERRSEPFLVPFLREWLRPGDVFVDVGAHWGTYSVVASELVGDAGRVLCVEPYRLSQRRLAQNLRMNGCRNATPLHCAVGPAPATGSLRIAGSGDNLNRLDTAGSPRALLGRARRWLGLDGVQACEVCTLASILDVAGLRRARLAKLDIEGGEWALGAQLMRLASRFDAIAIELHPRFAGEDDLAAMYAALAGGRDLFVFDGSRRRLRVISGLEDFLASVKQYYFASLASGCARALDDFTW